MKRIAFLLLVVSMLAGCTQLDAAKDELEEARVQLAEAQREAEEAKERYDRVKSASVVRAERLDVTLWPEIERETLRFDVEARRGDVSIPRENLTAMEPLAVRIGNATVWCDPLTCAIVLPPEGIEISWEGGSPWARYPTHVVCVDGPTESRCGQPPVGKRGVETRVTTAVGDITA